MFQQLWHGGITLQRGGGPVGPSPIPNAMVGRTPRVMTVGEIAAYARDVLEAQQF